MSNLIYAIVFLILKFISLLPLKVLYVFSDIFFLILYYILPYRKKVSFQNLVNSFPNSTPTQLKKTHKKFYRHFCDLIFESIKYMTISKNEILKRYTYKNFDVMENILRQKTDISLALGHYGNWEWGGSIAMKFNHTLLAIYKPIRNNIFDKLMYKIRSNFGVVPISKNNIIRELIQYKKQEKNVVAVFIVDQKPKLKTNSLHTIFLNQETIFFTGTEKIVAKFNHAVFFMNIRKKKRGYYEVEPILVSEKVRNSKKIKITKKNIQLLEKLIMEESAHWLWTHKRWKK